MKHLPLFFLAAALIFACTQQKGRGAASQRTDADLPAPADALFRLVPAAESGIAFQNTIKEDHNNNVIFNPYLYNGGGVAVLDVNNDGLQDLYFTATVGACKLYLNEGNFKFSDITAKAHVGAERGYKTGVTVVDINADGWQDLYVCRTGLKESEDRRNLLFVNNQDGTFTEVAGNFGLNDASPSNHINFFDYDRDGDLDAYLLNHPTDFKNVTKMSLHENPDKSLARNLEPTNNFESDRLYRNEGNGSFTDVSRSAGIWNRAFGLSVSTTDFNGDGYPDLFVGNDYIDPDFLYLNNRNGAFTDVAAKTFRHMTEHTMGADIADLNHDGLMDIVALDMLAEDYKRQKERITSMTNERFFTLAKYGYGFQMERNLLNINNGDGTFSDIGCLAGIFQTDWSWSVLAKDYDNDGWEDLFITNGYRRDVTNADFMMFTSDSVNKLPGGFGPKNFPDFYDFLNLIPEQKLQSYLYRNKGNLTFENVATAWGIGQKSFSNGAAYADLDNDGDLDLVVNCIEREALVYQNTAADKKNGNWLQIKLQGDGQNPFAIGARARVYAGENIFTQELTPTRGFFSSVELLLHFGLGQVNQIDRLELEFPGNKLIVMTGVPVNQRLKLDIKNAKPGKLTPLPASNPYFRNATVSRGLEFKHKEEMFFDFDRERLLPWQLSTPGPKIISGDANGDGLTDFYIGGATGSAGALFVQEKGGAFSKHAQATWDADARYEDAGGAFFDADGDGDQDLLLSSGGNTAPYGNELYHPRLYLNEGKGNFQRNEAALPKITESNAAVSIQDYDGDGDPDVFLGGWCRPGLYPQTPGSYILQNNKGVFSDVTASVSAEFPKLGMVRDMIWADLDGDAKAELVVVGEWMPVAVFKLTGGKLENKTAESGLATTSGFWRSVTAADLDGDGDKDLVCGNLGLNSRYRASITAPLEIFARDFDGNGSIDPIMVLQQDGERLPVAYRDVLIKQLPPLRKQFVRYTPYASASIEQVYPEKILKEALHFQANMLESTAFINEGGKFVAKPLPMLAQASPIYACLVLDVNQDGFADLVTAGNDYGQQVETGRIDAGNGCVLLGDGKGNFRPLYARESGFWANKEARSLALLPIGANNKVLLVGNSNDVLQVFEWKANKPSIR